MRATALKLVAVVAWAALSPAEAKAQESILAGNDYAVWAAVLDGNQYRLQVKPVNAPWESPWEGGQGRVAAIAPLTGDVAEVVFAQGEVVRYFRHRPSTRIGAHPPKELLGEQAIVMSACALPGGRLQTATNLGLEASDKNGGIVVLVNRVLTEAPAVPPQTAPTGPVTAPAPMYIGAPAAATKPTPGSAPGGYPNIGPASGPGKGPRRQLALLHYQADQWEQLAVLPVGDIGPRLQGHVAADAHAVYVLLSFTPPVLMALEQGRWRQIALPEEFQNTRPLTLARLEKGLAVAAYDPAPSGQSARVLIGRLDSEGQWQSLQPIRLAGNVVGWSAPPSAGVLGQRLVLLWQENSARFFGTVGFDGELSRQSFSAPEQTEPSLQAANAEQYFLWAVLGAMAVILFWPGTTIRAEPFSVPEGALLAPLVKRLGAFLVDYVPISAIVCSLIPGFDPEGLMQSDWPTVVPNWMIYGFVFSVGVYTPYCIVMEHRFGATLGKMLFRLTVVTDSGRRPGFRQILLRNLSRIPELRTGLLLLVPLFTRYRQRLGDKLARTAVIDTSVTFAPPPQPPEEPPQEPRDDPDEQPPEDPQP